MTRAQLKEILSSPSEKSRKLYRLYPDLYRFLVVWEDYLNHLSYYRKQHFRDAKNRARDAVLMHYRMGENTFYSLRSIMRDLCDDMSE